MILNNWSILTDSDSSFELETCAAKPSVNESVRSSVQHYSESLRRTGSVGQSEQYQTNRYLAIPKTQTHFPRSRTQSRNSNLERLHSDQVPARFMQYEIKEPIDAHDSINRPGTSVIEIRRSVLEQQRAKFHTKKSSCMQISRNMNYRAPILPGAVSNEHDPVQAQDSYFLNASDIHLQQKSFASAATDRSDKLEAEIAQIEKRLGGIDFKTQDYNIEEAANNPNIYHIPDTINPRHNKTQSIDVTSLKKPTREAVLNVSFKPNSTQALQPSPEVKTSYIDTTTPSVQFNEIDEVIQVSEPFPRKTLQSPELPNNTVHTRVVSADLTPSRQVLKNSHRKQSIKIPPPSIPRDDILAYKMKNMREFLMEPLPIGITLQCTIHRMKSGFNRLYPKYFLSISQTQEFLLAAKKRAGNKTSNYLISYDKENLTVKSSKYLGKLRAKSSGNKYAIYDSGMNPSKKGSSIYKVRQELAGCLYVNSTKSSSKSSSRGPRKIQVVIPAIKGNNERLIWKPIRVRYR